MKSGQAVPVVIIAGGQGRRIGGGKASRLLGGASLIEHAVQIADGYSNNVAVAAGDELNTPLPPHISVILDAYEGAGPISGLNSAFDFAISNGSSHVLIMACDTPFLPPDLMDKLCDLIGGCSAAIAQYDGDLHPACSLWRVDAAQSLAPYIDNGRRSLIGFAEAVGYMPVEWPASSFDPFFNINTVDDLTKAEQISANLQLTSSQSRPQN